METTIPNITIINSGGRGNNYKKAVESYSNKDGTSGDSILHNIRELNEIQVQVCFPQSV